MKFDIRNSLHKAIFHCVINGGAGDCKIVEHDDDNNGRIITSKQFGAGVYKWSLRNGKVYCCKQVAKVEF